MTSHEAHIEILRSSFSLNGTRIYLVHDSLKGCYRLASRWHWLTTFESVWDACDAFEALELLDGCERSLAKVIKREIKRVPRHHFVQPNSMKRIGYLIRAVERRAAGLRPQRCGSKGSVECWIPA